MGHQTDDLICLFNKLFERRYRCQLVRGGSEPLYRPASRPDDYHQLQFAHGFFASALHEVAHWCIAGEQRRQKADFGYWYSPGRGPIKQAEFETAEIAPQALEWVFCDAAGFHFRPSLDNLELQLDVPKFLARVEQAKAALLANGLPGRAGEFRRALSLFYRGDSNQTNLTSASLAGLI